MKLLQAIIGCCVILSSITLYAYEGLIRIDDVKIRNAEKGFSVRLSMNGKYTGKVKKPLLGGNYVQFSVPRAYVEPSRKIIEASGRYIKKVLVYQYDRRTVRLRVFFNSNVLNRKIFNNIVVKTPNKNVVRIVYIKNKLKLAEPTPIVKTEDIKPKDLVGQIMEKATSIAKKEKKVKAKASLEENLDEYLKKGEKSRKRKKASTTGAFGKMLYSLGIVILLVLSVAWLFKKFVAKGTKINVRNRFMEVLCKEYIGGKSYIALAKVMDRYLILGITNETISTLAELDEIPEEYIVNPPVQTKSKTLSNPLQKFSLKTKKVGKMLNNTNNAQNVFKKIINDVSGRMVNLSQVEKGKKEKVDNGLDLEGLRRLGEETLERRAKGLEKKGDLSNADEFTRNIASMIKDKVKDLPQI